MSMKTKENLYAKKYLVKSRNFKPLILENPSVHYQIKTKRISEKWKTDPPETKIHTTARKMTKVTTKCTISIKRLRKCVILKLANDAVDDIMDIENHAKNKQKKHSIKLGNRNNKEENIECSSELNWTYDTSDNELEEQVISVSLDHNYAEDCGRGRISFGLVSVFYFNRRQGCCTVPTEGENSIGMEMEHTDYKRFRLPKKQESSDEQKLVYCQLSTETKESEKENSFFFKGETDFGNIDKINDFSMKSIDPAWIKLNGLFSFYCLNPDKTQRLSLNLHSNQLPTMPMNHDDISNVGRASFPWQALVAKPFSPSVEALSGQIYGSGRLEKESMDSLSTRCLESFHKFHAAGMLDYADSSQPRNGASGDVSFETIKILEVVPEHQTSYDKLSQRNLRIKKKKDFGSQGLKPLTPKARSALLRSHGIVQLDRSESSSILSIRSSRDECGCSCPGPCYPSSCSCAANGVQCCVETTGFPCKCGDRECYNPQGRRVFDRMEVDMHFIITTMASKGHLI